MMRWGDGKTTTAILMTALHRQEDTGLDFGAVFRAAHNRVRLIDCPKVEDIAVAIVQAEAAVSEAK